MEKPPYQEFLTFLERVDAPDREVHVITDNYGKHKAPKAFRWFVLYPRYHLSFMPTSVGSLNQIEPFFATIATQRIPRGTFDSVPANV